MYTVMDKINQLPASKDNTKSVTVLALTLASISLHSK